MTTPNSSVPLLPPPTDVTDATKVEVDSGAIKFDALGPLVVNSDGTLSRIANWENMTEAERERTLRVLTARNRERIAEQKKKQEQSEGSEGTAPA